MESRSRCSFAEEKRKLLHENEVDERKKRRVPKSGAENGYFLVVYFIYLLCSLFAIQLLHRLQGKFTKKIDVYPLLGLNLSCLEENMFCSNIKSECFYQLMGAPLPISLSKKIVSKPCNELWNILPFCNLLLIFAILFREQAINIKWMKYQNWRLLGNTSLICYCLHSTCFHTETQTTCSRYC